MVIIINFFYLEQPATECKYTSVVYFINWLLQTVLNLRKVKCVGILYLYWEVYMCVCVFNGAVFFLQSEEEKEQRSMILDQIMTSEARERLNHIKLVKKEKAR